MLIVAGWYAVAPQDRDQVVESFAEMVGRARSAPGCMDLAISADPLRADRVNMYELWESEEALNAWRTVARPPRTSAILGGDVQKHEISSSGPPF